MSFMGGSACATGSNPLAQMAKQQSVDRSLQHEHMRSQTGRSSMRGAERQISAQDQQLYNEMGSGVRPNTFNFGDLRHELPRAGSQAPGSGPVPAAWASEFHQSPQHASQASSSQNWATEFTPGTSQQQPPMQGMYGAPGPSSGIHMPSMYSQYSGARYGISRNIHTPVQHLSPAPQSGKITELDDAKWEAQFQQFERSSSQEAQSETSEQASTQQPQQQEKNIDVADILQEKEISVDNLNDEATEDWLNSELYPPGWDDVWDRIKDKLNDDSGARFRYEDGMPVETFDKEYKFAEDNPYLNEEDPFAMGVALMDQGAKLSVAVLCFEAAIRLNPNHVEAWSRLGDAQAQNEVEDVAISALEKAVRLDPKNLKALMNLAISYTNEGYDSAASATLERWIAIKYPDLVEKAKAQNPKADANNRGQLHKSVTDLFLKAAQLSPDGANMDPDVQVGLGVLFYRNEDYTKAVDCFRAALGVRPHDALLWNRLGATLANASRPEEAIDAYYKALELRPSFVRARCNLGVSCINIGCYREAAEHLLSAISLHETGADGDLDSSANLMETLRRVFLAMDRRDLLVKIKPGMKLDEFRGEFNF